MKPKIWLTIPLVILIIIIGYIDTLTGLVPDLTVFYLIPVALVTLLLGLIYGIAFATISFFVEIIVTFQFNLSTMEIISNSILHFVVFLAIVVLVDRFASFTLLREIEEKRTRDLEAAKIVHKSIFEKIPANFGRYEIGSRVKYASELGGDYYYFRPVDGSLFFCIGDISGKSLAASLFTSLIHQNIIIALERTTDLEKIVYQVNKNIYPVLPDEYFFTFFCGRLFDDKLDYINAGHEPPLVLKVNDYPELTELTSREAYPLGYQKSLSINKQTVNLGKGSIIFLYTDGVTGSPALRAAPYKELEFLLRKHAGQSAQNISDLIFSEVLPHKTPLFDDAIIITLKR